MTKIQKYVKCLDVIDSCVTIKQLEVAGKWISRFIGAHFNSDYSEWDFMCVNETVLPYEFTDEIRGKFIEKYFKFKREREFFEATHP